MSDNDDPVEIGTGLSHLTLCPPVENSPIAFDVVEMTEGGIGLTVTHTVDGSNGLFATFDPNVSLETALRMMATIANCVPTGMSPLAAELLFPEHNRDGA